MSQRKEFLFLDTCWLIDAYGRKSGSFDRFKKIMSALSKKYELVITDRVYEEVTLEPDKYQRENDIKEWIEKGKDVRLIATNTPPGKDVGEMSIIETIENNLEFKDAKIASHDERFFVRNKQGKKYQNRIVRLNNILPELVKDNLLYHGAYYSLIKYGTPNLKGGWDRNVYQDNNPPEKPRNKFK